MREADLTTFVDGKARSLVQQGHQVVQFVVRSSKGGLKMQYHRSTGAVAQVEVYPDALYQTLPAAGKKHAHTTTLPIYIVAANGTLRLHKGEREAFPYLWSTSLQAAILKEARRRAPDLMEEQRKAGDVEVVGDIVCNPIKTQGRWQVVLDPCHNDTGMKWSSEPSCGRQRRCQSKRLAPAAWIDVGEYHTHPPTEGDRLCRPPSHYDVYQLLIGAHLQHHNYVLTVCTEGIYTTLATRASVQRLADSVWAYYEREDIHGVRFDPDKTQSAIDACRMPLVELLEKLPPARITSDVQYVHGLLVELPKVYYHLVENKREAPRRSDIIKRYLQELHRLGIRAAFHEHSARTS